MLGRSMKINIQFFQIPLPSPQTKYQNNLISSLLKFCFVSKTYEWSPDDVIRKIPASVSRKSDD